ncbi:hypothetical protein JOQ06_015733 [Pogonophryne albipinna]|uniref:Uncharacterized protein n=1 Tax=Pogonophryne albipinna TaxID=1090488 RepID=A0AAD6ANJ5_9TELE|nr:hypothetical protein JOQ06_015733 [Pogonophryne albipinna]
MAAVDCVRPANPSPNGQSNVLWREASPTLWRPPQMKPHPPSEDTRVLIVAARSSSTTWDSLLSLNAGMALPQPDPRPPLGPPLLNLAAVCPLE